MTDNFVSGYTSFLPLTPEVKSITSGFSFTKIFDFSWKKGKKSITNQDLPEEPENYDPSNAQNQQRNQSEQGKDGEKSTEISESCVSGSGTTSQLVPQNFGQSKSENSSPNVPRKEKGRYRNVKTILRRLSAIAVDKKWHQTSGDFKHDFKQYWMPDEHCKECYECGGKFSTFRRRHHCRVCGQIFCSRCCSQEVPGRTMGFNGNIRVCNYCYKIVKAYVEDDLDKSLEALKEDMKICCDDLNASEPFGVGAVNSLTSSRSSITSFHMRDDPGIVSVGSSNSLPGIIERELRSPTPRNPFDAFGVTPKEANDIKQDFLRDLWRQVTDARSKLELQSHRFRLKTYSNCFVGHELVDWLLTYGKAANRAQGVGIGQDLLDLGWIESIPATEEDIFRDEYMLYQPGRLAVPEMESQLSTPRDIEELSPCEDEGHESTSSVSLADDDDETLPVWFRQISSETVDTLTENPDGQLMFGTPSLARRFSSSRHLDLDQATIENGESKERVVARELSLQMKLDYFQDDPEKQVRKEIYDQTNKLSLITHVPPPPLDTYVCVEGHPFVAKKKMPKVTSASLFVDDILRGIEFPKPRSLHQIEPRDPMIDDNGECLARERLSFAAQHHLQALLKQLVEHDDLTQEWKDVIMPIVLRISEQVVPDVRRDDDMDIRQYVWFKAVPVGDKPECQVISGVVFTKNVVHKKMTCNFTQPRILMLSCAIEYQRVENKLTSIDPVVLQEYEFLKNFIARVVTLKPNIVLVEKTVARVAQDMLLKAGITLVHNIKSNVMENISRCTGADVLQSMEQVSRPRLGSCQQFRLHKYILPDGQAKTLMFFEGCAPDLGCSLVLQGADRTTLAKVKAIMKYLIYVAYHLKLENKFLMDEFALPPTLDHLVPCSNVKNEKTRRAVFKISEEDDISEEVNLDETLTAEDSQIHDAEMLDKYSKEKHDDILEESKKFSGVISKVILSSSPFCIYPLPYLLTKDGQTCSCRRFIPGQLYESRLLSEQELDKKPDQNAISFAEASQIKEVNPNLIMNEPHPFTRPGIVPRPQDGVTKCLLADFRARGGLVDLKMYRDFEELHKERRKEVNIKNKDRNERMGKGLLNIDVDVKVREKKNDNDPGTSDDRDKKMDCFDPYNHQRIAVLFSSYSSESHNAPKPCISPWAVFMEFYGRNDITLGGFLERYCFRPSYICYSHNCDIPMVNHVRYFAHSNGSLYIHMRNLESPIPGYDRTILTWSWCKQCKQVTPVVPLSFESWSLSFAKYLELRFYGGQYKRRASAEPCGHSLHQDHYQYFSFANMVASFKYRPIELYEVIIPSAEVVIGKERDPTEWFDDVEEFCCKAENVLIQISERINDLRTVDPGPNITREQNVKEFQSEFQAEKYHFNDFMQCLRMKVDSLLSSQRAEPMESHSLISSSSEFYDVSDNLKLKPSEVSALMTGIGNMLVNLKTKLCEIVLSWNLRLQEFLQQEKKREKSARPSSSPKSDHTPANIPSEMGEYYPAASADQLADSHAANRENSKYTYIHSPKAASNTDQEPISEVLLTNGTILRQTYLGTHPPKEYIASEIDNETLIKYGEEVDKKDGEQNGLNDVSDKETVNDDEVFNEGVDEAGREAEKEVEANSNSKPLKLDLEDAHKVYMKDNSMNSEKEEGNDRRNKVGSPYMVIQSPVTDDVDMNGEKDDIFDGSGSNTEATTSRKSSAALAPKSGMLTRTGSIQVERGSLTDIEGEVQKASLYIRMESHDSEYSHNSGQEHWMADSRGRSGTVINTEEQDDLPKYLARKLMHLGQSEDTSSHHSSMFVEDGSELDTSDLISLQDVLDFSDEDRSYMSEADDNEMGNSDIGLGESAVDYEMINEPSDDDLIEPVSFTKKLKSLGKEVDESSEYNSCESSPSMLRKKQDNYYTPTETREDSTKEYGTNECGTKESDTMASKVAEAALIGSKLDTTSLTALGRTHIRRDRKGLLKRRYPPLGIQEDDTDFNAECNAKLLPALEHSEHGVDNDAAEVQNEVLGPKIVGEAVDMDAQRKQLFENSSEGLLNEETNIQPRHILNSKENVLKGVGGKGDNVEMEENEHSKDFDAETTKDDIILTPKRTSFSEGRGLGHRRLQSAPVNLTPKRLSLENKAVHEESGLPGSPFELLRNTPHQDHSLTRTRSYSQGQTFDFRSSQDELTKIAEKICQVDRKVLEMDDAEEIQYDESLEETLGIPETSSKAGSEKKSKDSSEVFELDIDNDKKQEKANNTSKGTSDADESEKESVSSASATLRNRGHMRQKSLQYKAFGLAESKDDLEFTKSSTLEASQNLAGQKRGTEKMKKIISHLLPGSNFQPVPQPFPPYEHYLLAAGDSVSVVINEKEPSSIIAYALSSIGYFNQLSTLWKALSGPAEEDSTTQRKSPSATLKKESDASEINTNGVVLRQRKTQMPTSKRPRSWAGVSSKNPLLEYEISFQENTLEKGIEAAPITDPEILEKRLPIRTRMSFTDQSLLRSVTSYDTSSNDMLDSPSTTDFDDTKTDSVDGILDDKDDLDSVIDENKTNHTEEKTGKKKDENKPQIDFNIKLQFQDNSAKFYCNVYYAEQFRLLRELIFPEGEERYIQSLSRCVFWKARGGKSGSSFSKSLDDRFVMKQMSRPEVQSFLDFAPHYFQYMDKALKEQRPTTLAKILGVYRIGFKNSQTNSTMRQDVLVMENLFYNRKVNKIFDLKGSVRSRYVHTSGKEDVLMDENLLEMICETPLFIRPHSKAVLSKAIHNDSEFLSNHSVMDYSLLVGIDEVKFELVVGIIDYIRTYTWDKKLENYVKSTGILGGQGKMPTVVSPAVYRTRFTEAMHRYFLMVPDKWTGFGADLS